VLHAALIPEEFAEGLLLRGGGRHRRAQESTGTALLNVIGMVRSVWPFPAF